MAVAGRRSARLLRTCCLAAAGLLLRCLHGSCFAFGPRSSTTSMLAKQRIAAPRTGRPALGIDVASEAVLNSSLLTSFADQAGNINGVLFQSSLPAYLLFLYFLGYRGNNTPPLVKFGFSFLLAFVILTIPSGIISKSTYGLILADSDWLHGTAESLLTCTNIMIVLGFQGALTGDKALADNSTVRNLGLAWMLLVIATLAAGIPAMGFEAHTPFLAGLGGLAVDGLAKEPVNALSIPNWIVHWSTVFEFLLSMSLAWRYAEAVDNPRWKGLTWGMLCSSISSICALTFHIFYNQIPWILTAQALFTFLGNATLALATYRIAVSNGWTLSELDPRQVFAKPSDEVKEEPSFIISNISTSQASELTSGPLLVAEVIFLTLAFAYGTKYGELAFGSEIFQSPDSSAAAALVILVQVSLVVYAIYSRSPDLQSGQLPPLALTEPLVRAEPKPKEPPSGPFSWLFPSED